MSKNKSDEIREEAWEDKHLEEDLEYEVPREPEFVEEITEWFKTGTYNFGHAADPLSLVELGMLKLTCGIRNESTITGMLRELGYLKQ